MHASRKADLAVGPTSIGRSVYLRSADSSRAKCQVRAVVSAAPRTSLPTLLMDGARFVILKYVPVRVGMTLDNSRPVVCVGVTTECPIFFQARVMNRHVSAGRVSVARRVGLLALVVWYLILSAQSGSVLCEVFLSLSARAEDDSFPCTGHGCSCTISGECRSRCCCFPSAPDEARPSRSCERGADPARTRVSLVEVARCAGFPVDVKGVDLRVSPHLCADDGMARENLPGFSKFYTGCCVPRPSFPHGVDKVPIW